MLVATIFKCFVSQSLRVHDLFGQAGHKLRLRIFAILQWRLTSFVLVGQPRSRHLQYNQEPVDDSYLGSLSVLFRWKEDFVGAVETTWWAVRGARGVGFGFARSAQVAAQFKDDFAFFVWETDVEVFWR